MCGLAGFITKPASLPSETAEMVLHAMTNQIRHRGPDAEGFWIDSEAGIALGHRRLSILDLSAAGAQPMHSADGRYVLVFNGEIYNHRALRAQLEAGKSAPAWRGHSDTETLLAAIATWGLVGALQRAQGMFALALWDRRERALIVARDRMGEKPLYCARLPAGWAFASELKALCKAPGFHPRIDADAVNAFLAFGYVPEGSCIYEGAHKLRPGHFALLDLDSDHLIAKPYETFGDLAFPEGRIRQEQPRLDMQGMSIEMESLLAGVIDEQMLSDVPVGCFLSGGIDSSLVASLMQANRQTQINTFSVGFDDIRYDEAHHAARVARHIGTAHTEFIVSEDDALAVIPELPIIYDEPFADSSQIPTLLLCRAARQSVTVALTGDGGDEVFGGYNRHVFVPWLWNKASRVPTALRRPLGRMVGRLDRLAVSDASPIRRWTHKAGLPLTAVDKLSKASLVLSSADCIEDLYHFLVTTFEDSGQAITGRASQQAIYLDDLDRAEPFSTAEWFMAMDCLNYLPGDILVKVDRAAMSASLETRTPFLDARVIRAAWNLPVEARVKKFQGKRVLRAILDRHVPRAMVDRPKQGFSLPLDRWLRGALRGWAEELVCNQGLLSAVRLDSTVVSGLWNEHQEYKRNNGQKLWTILMLLSWIQEYSAFTETTALDTHRNFGI